MEILTQFIGSSFWWYLIILLFVLVLIFILYKTRKTTFGMWFEIMYEKMYDFYAEILWEKSATWIKTYIITLFFVILFSNFFWIFLELIAPIFWADEDWNFLLEHYITVPSSDLNFNLALAIISVWIILFIQFKSMWFNKFLLDYFPVFWKNYITIEKSDTLKYKILKPFVKTFDIFISMFLGFLEIVWLIAKIISLSFRLFWNMTSWTVLLAMAVVWLSSFTNNLIWFEFPVFLPVLIYLQEILVAFIQALVFPLLVAIFIKVASAEGEE